MPCHAMPCHAMPCHAMPCHAMPCHTIPYHTIPYHTIPYHTIPYHTIPYHTIPYHTIPENFLSPLEKISTQKNMLRGNPPPLQIPFYSFSLYLFSFIFQKQFYNLKHLFNDHNSLLTFH